jgi:exonuclease VII small subunit
MGNFTIPLSELEQAVKKVDRGREDLNNTGNKFTMTNIYREHCT